MEIEIKITRDGVSETKTFNSYASAMSNVYMESLEHMNEQRSIHPEAVEEHVHLR